MIVGVDLSTHRIDLAWMSPRDGFPQRWHQSMGTKGKTLDRLRKIELHWPYYEGLTGINGEVIYPVSMTDLIIEWPYGHSSNYLMAVVGVITHSAPSWVDVHWMAAGKIRGALGIKNTKGAAQEWAMTRSGWLPVLAAWNEHEIDALVTCLGGTHILEHPTSKKEQ